jgi:hypothetical protein
MHIYKMDTPSCPMKSMFSVYWKIAKYRYRLENSPMQLRIKIIGAREKKNSMEENKKGN